MPAETPVGENRTHPVSYWAGWVVSLVPCVPLAMSAGGMLLDVAEVRANFASMSYPERIVLPLGLTLAASVVLYLVPRTAVLGAIMLTGFFGGAIDVHVREGEWLYLVPVACALLVWLGLYLREGRVRALMPLRS